jgi:hypothetical protein
MPRWLKKQAPLLSPASAYAVLTWGQAKQDSASVRTVVSFQRRNRQSASRSEVYESILLSNGSRDSSVSIGTGYRLDDQGGGSSSPGRVKNFHFSI